MKEVVLYWYCIDIKNSLSPLSLVRLTPFPWRSLCCSGCRRSAVTGGSSACWTGSRWRGGASCWCWSNRHSVRICSTSSLRRERCRNASPSGSTLCPLFDLSPCRRTRVKVLRLVPSGCSDRSSRRCGSFTLTASCTETSKTRTSWWTRGRSTSRSSTSDQELHSKRRRTASSKVQTHKCYTCFISPLHLLHNEKLEQKRCLFPV